MEGQLKDLCSGLYFLHIHDSQCVCVYVCVSMCVVLYAPLSVCMREEMCVCVCSTVAGPTSAEAGREALLLSSPFPSSHTHSLDTHTHTNNDIYIYTHTHTHTTHSLRK